MAKRNRDQRFCLIRWAGNETGYEIKAKRQIKRLRESAAEWAAKVRNRRRWAHKKSMRAALAREAEESVRRFVGRATTIDRDLQDMATSDVVEVSIPFDREDPEASDAARRMPWEYLISAATKKYRGSRTITVVRHLDCGDDEAMEWTHAQTGAVIVQSTPGELADHFDFDGERRVIESHIQTSERITFLTSPSLEELTKLVGERKPAVIHLTGVDAHLGASVLANEYADEDGFYLTGRDGTAWSCPPHRLASALTRSRNADPALISFNAYNSAEELAAFAVGYGAAAAIGFQNEFDDSLAELFLSTFYRAWQHSNRDTLLAFTLAWRHLRNRPLSLQGSGVVLWSERSLIPTSPAERRRLGGTCDMVAQMMEHDRQSAIVIQRGPDGHADREDLDRVLSVEVEPEKSLNYAVLHNGGAVFRKFNLRQFVTGTLKGVEVEVVLHAGSESLAYRGSFDRDSSMPTSLKEDIRIPLGWDLGAIEESVRSTLYVCVRHGGTTFYEQTHPITIDPANEWRDTWRDGFWLPSFVLPRERAVHDVVKRAGEILVDDCHEEFMGYDGADATPDRQAMALWRAIQSSNLVYIYPPPAYTRRAQRLRTPAEVFSDGQGTCADLALLFASCLEWITLNPVLFILEYHMFVGYWMTADAYAEFTDETLRNLRPTLGGRGYGGDLRPDWVVGPEVYGELAKFIKNDGLKPVEATFITGSAFSFDDAADEGKATFMRANPTQQSNQDPNQGAFVSLIDITLAREHGVTPIPRQPTETARIPAATPDRDKFAINIIANSNTVTHDLNIDQAQRFIAAIHDSWTLSAVRQGELIHPKHEGGRKRVLQAIDDRMAELGG